MSISLLVVVSFRSAERLVAGTVYSAVLVILRKVLFSRAYRVIRDRS